MSLFGDKSFNIDSFAEEILVLLNRVVSSTDLPMRWTVILVEAVVLFALLEITLQLMPEVKLREKSMIRHKMIVRSRFKVPQVTELSHAGVS